MVSNESIHHLWYEVVLLKLMKHRDITVTNIGYSI